MTEPKLPLILGHRIVGTVVAVGERAADLEQLQAECFELVAAR